MARMMIARAEGWVWQVLAVALWAFTAFNLPSRVEQGGRAVDFGYDAVQQRAWRRTDTGDLTTYVSEWYEHRRAGGLSQHLFSVKAEGRTVATVAVQEGAPEEQVLYVHDDHLGSVETLTNAAGEVVQHFKYDPFGARADPRNPARQWTPTATAPKRGFTGHEHDEDLSLIHMRGRVYDPRTGRFLSRDPVVQFPHATQAYNRYAYALNNPLSWVDPSGFSVERHLALRSDLPTISITKCWGACTPAEPPSSGDQGQPGDKPHSTSSADDNGPNPTDSPGNRPTQGPPSPEQRSRVEVLDSLQTALDVAGMLPGVGLAFDVVNAGIHAARGNWGEAALSLVGAVPAVGDALKGAVLAKKAYMDAHAAKALASTKALSVSGGVLGATISRGASKAVRGTSGLGDLARLRSELGLAQGQGTLARLDVGGRSFYGINAHGQPVSLRVNAISRTHAEADVFQQAANAGSSGTHGTLYVDRALCQACGPKGGVRMMAAQIGLTELQVVTPQGMHLIRP